MYQNLNAIILAGGKSSRLGVNKCLLKIDNQFFIEKICSVLKPLFPKIIISANSDEYDFLNCVVVKDIYKSKGPLGGLFSALKFSDKQKNFVCTCDMPLIDRKLIDFIVSEAANRENLWVSLKGRLHPLLGVYNRDLIPLIEQKIKFNSLEVRQLSERFFTLKLPNYFEQQLINVNTWTDYRQLKQLEAKSK